MPDITAATILFFKGNTSIKFRDFGDTLVNSASRIEKLSFSIFFQKRHKEMETKLPMSVVQNLLATCWFYIIIMRGIRLKTFFIFFCLCQLCVT